MHQRCLSITAALFARCCRVRAGVLLCLRSRSRATSPSRFRGATACAQMLPPTASVSAAFCSLRTIERRAAGEVSGTSVGCLESIAHVVTDVRAHFACRHECHPLRTSLAHEYGRRDRRCSLLLSSSGVCFRSSQLPCTHKLSTAAPPLHCSALRSTPPPLCALRLSSIHWCR